MDGLFDKPAWTVISDGLTKAKMHKLAPDAKVGSPVAHKTFKIITSKYDFDDSDGYADKYNHKSLGEGHGGRTSLLIDAVQVDGGSYMDGIKVARMNFLKIVSSGDTSNAPLEDKVSKWRASHQ